MILPERVLGTSGVKTMLVEAAKLPDLGAHVVAQLPDHLQRALLVPLQTT
jgi:hypothetical protein